MDIFGNKLTATELKRRIGNMSQLGGTRHYELTEGSAKGVRAVDCRTGTGFDFTVLPDRGMDISLASYQGMNLVYLSPTGEVNPAFYNCIDSEWLRSFFAGLLTTCGLTYFGPPGKDGEDDLGLHGRIANIPAKQVCDLSGWHGDDYVIRITGTIDEAFLFGDKIRLERTISSKLGGRSLQITDIVTNTGFRETPFNILYHINTGFPLLDEGAELIISSRKVTPYCDKSAQNIADACRFTSPHSGFTEENFLHEMAGDADGYGYSALVNRNLNDGLGLYVKFNLDALPLLSEWKMMGEGDYVVAIEPVNTKLDNRAVLRQEGKLPMLQPGESRKMNVEIGILDGKAEIGTFHRKVETLKNH